MKSVFPSLCIFTFSKMFATKEELEQCNIRLREIGVELSGDNYIEKMNGLRTFIKNFTRGKIQNNRLYTDIVD